MNPRIALKTLSAEEWHRVLQSFSDSRIEQTLAYANLRAPRSTIRHLVLSEDSLPVAAAQIVARRVPLAGTWIMFVKNGPFWRPRTSEPQQARLNAILTALHERLVQEEGAILRVMPAADPLAPDLLIDSMGALGFARTTIASPNRYYVDLALSEPELRASLKGKWRYNLRRAERHGMNVRLSDGTAAMRDFVQMHRSMQRRKSFAESFDVAMLPQLAELPAALRPRLLVCEIDGGPVAAAVISISGDTAVYLFGAMNQRGAELDAGYVLHWQVLEWLKTTACRWYDLGGDCGDPGLRQFKSGLVGKMGRVVSMPGYFDAARTTGKALMGRAAFGLRDTAVAIRTRLRR